MNTTFQQLRFTPSLSTQLQPPQSKPQRVSSPYLKTHKGSAQNPPNVAQQSQGYGFKPFYPTRGDNSFSHRRSSTNMDREEMSKIKNLLTSVNDSEPQPELPAKKPSFNPFQQLHLQGQLSAKPQQPIVLPQQKAIKSMAGPNILQPLNTPMATLQQQLEQLQSQKQGKGRPKKQLTFSSKQEMIRYIENFRLNYKTEICRNWKNSKECEFGDECAYAHGYDELQQKPPSFHKNYKTKMCKNWHENTPGECSYGDKCQFIHDEPDMFVVEDEPKLASLLEAGLSKVQLQQQLSQLRLSSMPAMHPLQPLSAFNQCYFSSHPNKKAVEKAVYSQAFQNQVKDYTMMNLTKYSQSQEPQEAATAEPEAFVEQAAETPLTEESKRKFMFSMFKPLDLYWHNHYYQNPVDQHAPVDGGDTSSSCNLSECDFKSIEKNLENEILNQSFEELPSPEDDLAEEAAEPMHFCSPQSEEHGDLHEANSIGSQILTRKRLRIFDEITHEANGESQEVPKRCRQRAEPSPVAFGLTLKACENSSA